MSAPLISFTSEIDDLSEVQSIAKATFQQHYCKIIKDIMIYNSDACGDLLKLKKQLRTLAESHKEMISLIAAINRINSLSGKENLTGEEAVSKFQELYDDILENGDIDDEQLSVIESIGSFINDEQETEETTEEDGELLVTKTAQDYIDPLTKQQMIDPVKSRNCGHAYERESIMKYLSESKRRCPYSGCQITLGKTDLMDHFVLKVKLSMQARN